MAMRGNSQHEGRRPGTSPDGLAPAPTAGAAEPVLRVSNLRKSFGAHTVLDRLSLEVPEGRTTVVLGPSGCGKSVLLKHIVGLLRPDSGEIYFAGQRIDNLSEARLRPVRTQISLVFQMGALFDSLSVEENIAFPLIEHSDLNAGEIRARVARALETVDMLGFERRVPAELSGGQRKRVALARAVVTRPRVILYDEPTTGLDPIRSEGINNLIIKLKDTLGVTGVVVTHDLASARRVADRVVMLLGGRVAASGSFVDLDANPDPAIRRFFHSAELRSTGLEPDDAHEPSELPAESETLP